MSFLKLEQIKMKYGYSSGNQAFLQPNSTSFAANNQEDGISQHIQLKINTSRMHQQKRHPEKTNLNMSNVNKQQLSSGITANKIFSSAPKKKNDTFDESSLFLEEPRNQRVLRQSIKHSNRVTKEMKDDLINGQSQNRNYDLIKNYRRKIKDTFQTDSFAGNRNLEANLNKTAIKNENNQKKAPLSQISQFSLKHANKSSTQAQNERSQQITKMGVKIRRNLLQGIDMNKIDLRAQLSHIEKLQLKIQSALGSAQQ